MASTSADGAAAPPLGLVITSTGASAPPSQVSWRDLEAELEAEVAEDATAEVGFWLVTAGLGSTAASAAVSVPADDPSLRLVGALTGGALALTGLVVFLVGATQR